MLSATRFLSLDVLLQENGQGHSIICLLALLSLSSLSQNLLRYWVRHLLSSKVQSYWSLCPTCPTPFHPARRSLLVKRTRVTRISCFESELRGQHGSCRVHPCVDRGADCCLSSCVSRREALSLSMSCSYTERAPTSFPDQSLQRWLWNPRQDYKALTWRHFHDHLCWLWPLGTTGLCPPAQFPLLSIYLSSISSSQPFPQPRFSLPWSLGFHSFSSVSFYSLSMSCIQTALCFEEII